MHDFEHLGVTNQSLECKMNLPIRVQNVSNLPHVLLTCLPRRPVCTLILRYYEAEVHWPFEEIPRDVDWPRRFPLAVRDHIWIDSELDV